MKKSRDSQQRDVGIGSLQKFENPLWDNPEYEP